MLRVRSGVGLCAMLVFVTSYDSVLSSLDYHYVSGIRYRLSGNCKVTFKTAPQERHAENPEISPTQVVEVNALLRRPGLRLSASPGGRRAARGEPLQTSLTHHRGHAPVPRGRAPTRHPPTRHPQVTPTTHRQTGYTCSTAHPLHNAPIVSQSTPCSPYSTPILLSVPELSTVLQTSPPSRRRGRWERRMALDRRWRTLVASRPTTNARKAFGQGAVKVVVRIVAPFIVTREHAHSQVGQQAQLARQRARQLVSVHTKDL